MPAGGKSYAIPARIWRLLNDWVRIAATVFPPWTRTTFPFPNISNTSSWAPPRSSRRIATRSNPRCPIAVIRALSTALRRAIANGGGVSGFSSVAWRQSHFPALQYSSLRSTPGRLMRRMTSSLAW